MQLFNLFQKGATPALSPSDDCSLACPERKGAGDFEHRADMSSTCSGCFASQPTLSRAPYRNDVVISCPVYIHGLSVYTRCSGKGHQPGLRRRRNGTHRASRITLITASNTPEAQGYSVAERKASETSIRSVRKQSAVQGVCKSGAKVSDKLRAAVKQVDKQVHEVVAVPVPQNTVLAPHMNEHPGDSIESRPSSPSINQSLELLGCSSR